MGMAASLRPVKQRIGDWVELVLMASVPVGLLGGCFYLLGTEAIEWLRTGEVTSQTVTVSDVFPRLPPIEWIGVRRIVTWFGEWPLWFVLLVLGGICAFGWREWLREKQEADRKRGPS
jgi:hypothetical protein